MATANRVNNPLTPMRPGAEVLEEKRFARDWIQWLRNAWDAITSLQRLTPSVVVTSVTAAYTAQPGDLVLADPTTGAFSVTLPVLTSDTNDKLQVDVKHNSDSTNDVTVVGTIDGATNFVLKAREDITCNRIPGSAAWVIR